MSAAKAAGKPSRTPDLVGEGRSTTGEQLGDGKPPATAEPATPATKPDSGGESQEPRRESSSRGPLLPAPGTRVNTGAGFVLGALFWAWIGLPFLKGGPTGVKNTLRAKFFNKAADGSWLP